ncbi:hypothetical protein [Roseibium polysiphoniae]|uniref:hypothetical protein n=1 Tax=Roseibium polysiphoniae TaxID=2571221 RepID=UPI0032976544
MSVDVTSIVKKHKKTQKFDDQVANIFLKLSDRTSVDLPFAANFSEAKKFVEEVINPAVYAQFETMDPEYMQKTYARKQISGNPVNFADDLDAVLKELASSVFEGQEYAKKRSRSFTRQFKSVIRLIVFRKRS